MASKKMIEAFNKKVEKIVLTHGGTSEKPIGSGKRWTIKTKAGDLSVSVHEPEKMSLYSIFCRFDKPKEALELLIEVGLEEKVPNARNDGRLNRYSGKHNYHFSDERDTLVCFEMEIELILK